MNVKMGKRHSLKNGKVSFCYSSFLGYKKGADGGNAACQHSLGCAYMIGEYVKKDAQKAFNSLKGTYVGTVMDNNVPTRASVTIGRDFSVRDLPIRPLLKDFLSDEEMAEALKTVKGLVYQAPTVSMAMTEDRSQLLLVMEPTDWQFTVTAGGKDYEISALMSAAVVYFLQSEKLSMEIVVQSLSCNGQQADLSLEGISYFIDQAEKQ